MSADDNSKDRDAFHLASGGSASSAMRLDDISKNYGSTLAVEGLTLELNAGKVHALIGENGAGKSTAAQVAAGVVTPSGGRLLLSGAPVEFRTARDAEASGVVLIPQELRLYEPLSIAENLFVGRRRPRNRLGLVDVGAMRARAEEALARLASDLRPTQRVEDLSPASRQIVAVARALMIDARVLIMDEPTAALDEWEAQRLLEVVNRLRDHGVAVLYVSHRMHEVAQISDEITVMRDGRVVAQGGTSTFTPDQLVHLMVGRSVTLLARETNRASDEVVLRANRLSRKGQFSDVSLEVRAGEVLGLAGIVGSGRSEFAQSLFGYSKPSSGTVTVCGVELQHRSVRRTIKAGLGYVPEERQTQGLFGSLPVERNTSITTLERLQRFGMVSRKEERAAVEDVLRPLRLRGSVNDLVSSLSGGNQQKVLLARWLLVAPRVVILDEPTRGIDVGTRAEIYDLIDELTQKGIAVLLISSDLQELLLLSDRIAVMRQGSIVREFTGDEMTEFNVGGTALGHLGASA